jgi:hypothetical protein
MDKDIKVLMQAIPAHQVPAGLKKKIIFRISERQRRIATIRFVLFLSILLMSVTYIMPAVSNLYSEMVQSGFFEFVSLLFSNFSHVLVVGGDYLFSLMEYLPIFSLAVFLFTFFTILLSARFLLRDIKTVFPHSYQFKL